MPISIQPTVMKFKNEDGVYQSAGGLKGDPGEAPSFSIGAVITGEPGSDADVTMTGTPEEPILNFTIPRGDSGNAVIDDTAGDGDTDKVWSADKSEKAQKVSVLTPVGNVHVLQPCPVTYSFGEKATLTVTVTADTQYHFMFSCPEGAATALTMNGITGRAGNAIEEGKTYEVDVWAGIAMVREIEVTPVS